MTCVICGAAIVGEFYRLGTQEICSPCHAAATGEPAQDRGSALAAAGAGLLGALLGGIIYGALLHVFDWYGGFTSFLVGIGAGIGVSRVRPRSPWLARTIAAVTAYVALACWNVPKVLLDVDVYARFAAQEGVLPDTLTGFTRIQLALTLASGFGATILDNPGTYASFLLLTIGLAVVSALLSCTRSSSPSAFTGPYR